MASMKLLKERLDDIENICCELQERINIKDLWADNKIYAIAAVVKQEVKELRNEIEELGANCSMRHDNDI